MAASLARCAPRATSLRCSLARTSLVPRTPVPAPAMGAAPSRLASSSSSTPRPTARRVAARAGAAAADAFADSQAAAPRLSLAEEARTLVQCAR